MFGGSALAAAEEAQFTPLERAEMRLEKAERAFSQAQTELIEARRAHQEARRAWLSEILPRWAMDD